MTQPPRELTPAVRRRAWAEPKVRSWWLIAVVLLVIAMVLAGMSYVEWATLARAVNSGVVVPARIIAVEGDKRIGRTVTSTSGVGMEYTYNSQKHYVVGTLSGLVNQVRVGDDVPLHIDPNDPENWTVRDVAPPLAQQMIGPILVLPVAVVCGLIALVGRAGVLRTYQNGAAAEAMVAMNRQTPLAPKSRAIRCSLTSGSRMMEVFVPRSAGQLNEGDTLWVILPKGRGRPVAVDWFEES